MIDALPVNHKCIHTRYHQNVYIFPKTITFGKINCYMKPRLKMFTSICLIIERLAVTGKNNYHCCMRKSSRKNVKSWDLVGRFLVEGHG